MLWSASDMVSTSLQVVNTGTCAWKLRDVTSDLQTQRKKLISQYFFIQLSEMAWEPSLLKYFIYTGILQKYYQAKSLQLCSSLYWLITYLYVFINRELEGK